MASDAAAHVGERELDRSQASHLEIAAGTFGQPVTDDGDLIKVGATEANRARGANNRDLVGREAYLGYLVAKFATIEKLGSVVRVEVGEAPGGESGAQGRPCALIEQDGSLLATVFVDVVGGRISQISMGPNPPPGRCRRGGELPGFEGEEAVVN